MLAGCQEGGSGEDGAVPEGDFSVLDALPNKAFPGVILEDHIAQQGIVGNFGVHFGARFRPGLPLVEVVGRNHGFAADGDVGKQQKRQNKKSCRNEKVGQMLPKPVHF